MNFQDYTTVGSLLAVVAMGTWSNWNTNRTVREMQAQRSSSGRPRLEFEDYAPITETDVIITMTMTTQFDQRTKRHTIRLRNIGAGTAYDVAVDTEKSRGGRIECFSKPRTVKLGEEFAVTIVMVHPIHELPDFTLALRYRDLDDTPYHAILNFDIRQTPPRVTQNYLRGLSMWEKPRSFLRSTKR